MPAGHKSRVLSIKKSSWTVTWVLSVLSRHWKSDLESARTYGVLYQWGRKDPMPGSADGSYEEANTIFNADGYTIPLGKEDGGSLANSIANPSTFIVRCI